MVKLNGKYQNVYKTGMKLEENKIWGWVSVCIGIFVHRIRKAPNCILVDI